MLCQVELVRSEPEPRALVFLVDLPLLIHTVGPPSAQTQEPRTGRFTPNRVCHRLQFPPKAFYQDGTQQETPTDWGPGS